MAELKKVEDFQYDIPVVPETVPENPTKVDKVQKDLEIPLSPKKSLKNISLFEKLITVVLIVAIIGVAIVTIQLRTSIDEATNTITDMQRTISQKEEAALKLEQEKSELSKADRLKKIAKDKGLSEIDENIKNLGKVK